MRIFLLVIFSCFTFEKIQAQQSYADSLKNVFLYAKEDSTKTFALYRLSWYYSLLYPDSALYYADKLIQLSTEENHLPKALGYICKGEALDRVGSYPEALEAAFQGLEIARALNSHRSFVMGRAYSLIGHVYHMTGNSKESVGYFHKALPLLEASHEYSEDLCLARFSMAFSMLATGNKDSALYYVGKAKSMYANPLNQRDPGPWLCLINGTIYRMEENYDSAEYYHREGIKVTEKFNAPFAGVNFYVNLADILYTKKEMDSCIYYAQKSLALCQKYKYKNFEVGVSGFLARVYDKIDVDSAYKYFKIMVAANEEVNNANRVRQFQKVGSDAEKREKELQDAKARFRNSLKLYALITLLSFFVLIAIIFWRNNRQRKKANTLLIEKKEKLEHTLAELKSTQDQLIQSEKMASLGELTAGIAHEIQNPLNFVNNFSEVNEELLRELKTEAEKGNLDDVKAIANDIALNSEKINHHGKRADTIVKGMLQHSRANSGQKEPTDINKLADEYLRLAYHGLRAKDKSFNANFKTELDNSIGKINVAPQEMGRVILNLINNAFYAVNEKQKQNLNGYEPTVTITTAKRNGKVEIKVKDNGIGIPQKILDKIFQPFFTTKPTGQGTGLGLSLAYDIITKGHGGELGVETKESGGSEFIIWLPLT
ncbi:MAG TPA: ATP-binding protein [Chryseolinea sp.]|nr:ATP-binding protein [Chryseolinea sp.]